MYSKKVLEFLGFKRGDCIRSDGYTLYILGIHEGGVEAITKGPYAGPEGLKPKADQFGFMILFAGKERIEEVDAALRRWREKLSVPCILSGADSVLASAFDDARKIAISSSTKEAIWGEPGVVDALVKRESIATTEEIWVFVDEGASKESVLQLLLREKRVSNATDFNLLDKTSFAAKYYAGLEDITIPSGEERYLFLDEAPANFKVFSLMQSYNGDVQIRPYRRSGPPSQSSYGDSYFESDEGHLESDDSHGMDYGYGEGDDFQDPSNQSVRQWLIVRSAAIGSDALLETIVLMAPEEISDVSQIDGLPKAFNIKRAADSLPDMTGFETMTLGSGSCQWTSPGYLLADRDLVVGETIWIRAVAHLDGSVLKSVELTATEDNYKKTVWPKALIDAINADTTLVEGSTLLQAGHLSKDGFIIAEKGIDSNQFCAADELGRAEFDRLWVFEALARMYTNAPFVANQVIAGYVPDAFPAWAEGICIQVRDRTSQYLHESHRVACNPLHDEQGDQQKHVCNIINQHSKLLRAGVLKNDEVTIKAAIEANALWVPQGSNLSVTVEPIMWFALDGFAVEGSLTAGETICLNVHDDVSGVPMPGSPFTFTPKVAEIAEAVWPSALSQALKQSLLADYIHLGKAEDFNKDRTENATTDQWWQAGVPLRIWMSEPLGGAPLWVPAASEVKDQNKAISLYKMLEAQANADTELYVELRDRRSGNLCYNWTVTLAKGDSADYVSGWVETLQATLEAKLKALGIASSVGDSTHAVLEKAQEIPASSRALWLEGSADVLLKLRGRVISKEVELPDVKVTMSTAEVRNQVLGVFLLCARGLIFGEKNELPREIYDEFLATLRLNDCWAWDESGWLGDRRVKLSDKFESRVSSKDKSAEANLTAAQREQSEVSNMVERYFRKTVLLNLNKYGRADFHYRMNRVPFFREPPQGSGTHRPGRDESSELLCDYEVCRGPDSEDYKDYFIKGRWAQDIRLEYIMPDEVLWALFKSKAAWKYLSASGYDYVERQLASGRDKMFKYVRDGVKSADEELLIELFDLWAFPGNINLPENASASCSVSFVKPEKFTVANVSGRSVAVTVHGHERLQLASMLAPPAIASGYKFQFTEAHADQLLFDIHRPDDSTHTHPEIWNGYVTAEKIWQCVGLNSVILPVAKKCSPPDTLCADYASTNGSKLYDTSGACTNGVDERTGLFHAHYPLCTLQGMAGRGPVIDLSLHYSARRANESALGDGWAFRFSSFDNRERQLTLSTGRTAHLSLSEIRTLIADKKNKVQYVGFTITDAQGSEDRLSSLTLEFPDGRKEVISQPCDHDSKESGSAYVKFFGEKVRLFLKQSEPEPDQKKNPVIAVLFGAAFDLFGADLIVGAPGAAAARTAWTAAVTEFKGLIKKYKYALWENCGRPEGEFKQQLEVEHAQTQQVAAMARLRAQFVQTLENLTRPALLLTTSSITSAQGETLTFEWQGVEGHVRLKNIKDGDTVLLNASHGEKPVLEGTTKTTFTLWPDTDEQCTVVLDIEDCLLKTLTRYRDADGSTVDQCVKFGYSRDLALDRVLTTVAEEDGSVEVVKYGASSERILPRVSLHTIIPGANQPNITHAWKWSGYDYVISAMKTPILNGGVDADEAPFTRWDWTVCDDGGSLLDRIIEEVPGQQRRTTQYSYQQDTTDYQLELKPLARALQVSTIVTVEALDTLPVQEQQS
ncbi:hypothetical protein AB7M33_003954 [Pseudomonas sp. Y3 TE3536]